MILKQALEKGFNHSSRDWTSMNFNRYVKIEYRVGAILKTYLSYLLVSLVMKAIFTLLIGHWKVLFISKAPILGLTRRNYRYHLSVDRPVLLLGIQNINHSPGTIHVQMVLMCALTFVSRRKIVLRLFITSVRAQRIPVMSLMKLG